MSGVILKCAKKTFERVGIKKFAMIVSYERTGIVSSNFLTKLSEDCFLKIKRLSSEYQLFFNARYASFLIPNSFYAST